MLLIASHVLVITCCFLKKTQLRELPKNHIFESRQSYSNCPALSGYPGFVQPRIVWRLRAPRILNTFGPVPARGPA